MHDALRFSGRILMLCDDADRVDAQLRGIDLPLSDARPLRDDVSTDEITPVTTMFSYDETLGRYPYVGFTAGGRRPIGPDAVRRGGFAVTVAGRRYGKGSSRESSPLAEYHAGIRLVIAESFERIYQQNCDNLGLLTSTDFSLVERIRAGEAIPMTAFVAGRDALTRRIIVAGGLLKYRATGEAEQGAGAATAGDAAGDTVGDTVRHTPGPRTLVDKILARHAVPGAAPVARGEGGFFRADWRFSHDYFTGMAAHFMHRAFGDPAPLHDPAGIVAFLDHLVLAPHSAAHRADDRRAGVEHLVGGHRRFVRQYPVRTHGTLPGGDGAEGICHALMTERHALPGQLVVGTDSHTPHAGALGCLAFGTGATDMAYSWVTGLVRCRVPDTVRVRIDGVLRDGVTAKDVVLHLLRLAPVRRGDVVGCVVEYGGDAVRAMSVDERATLTNMTAELGGFTGIVAPDARTVAFLRERRGIDFVLEDWMASDDDAPCRAELRVDAARIGEMVARPGDPGNGVALDTLAQVEPVDIAYGGSCTGGKREDFDHYHAVLRWAVARGRSVAPRTRLYLQFGTIDVLEYCRRQGYLPTFEAAGAQLVMPGCGACANCGPGQSTDPGQVTVSAINRNFPGRSGPGRVWLASPFTVAASAIAGRLTGFAALRGDVPA